MEKDILIYITTDQAKLNHAKKALGDIYDVYAPNEVCMYVDNSEDIYTKCKKLHKAYGVKCMADITQLHIFQNGYTYSVDDNNNVKESVNEIITKLYKKTDRRAYMINTLYFCIGDTYDNKTFYTYDFGNISNLRYSVGCNSFEDIYIGSKNDANYSFELFKRNLEKMKETKYTMYKFEVKNPDNGIRKEECDGKCLACDNDVCANGCCSCEEEKPLDGAKYEYVNNPKHYNNYDIECVDMIERIWGPFIASKWCELNAFKYRIRMGNKPNEDVEKDLDKEKKYLELYEKYSKKWRDEKYLRNVTITEEEKEYINLITSKMPNEQYCKAKV